MISIAIDRIRRKFENNSDVGIAFLYFSYKRPADQVIETLIGSLLKQMVQGLHSLPSEAEALYRVHHGKATRPNVIELRKMLGLITRRFSKSFILMDALDECIEPKVLTRLLEEILDLQKHQHISIFATSRSLPDILTKFSASMTLRIHADDADARAYLKNNMVSLAACVRRNADLQARIIAAIVQAAGGM